MTEDELADQILKQTKQNHGRKKISCRRAHLLAEELAVSVKTIGRVCHQEGIKIVNCQLGCFGDKTGA